ncbi:MAG TPA: hypothetical protein VGJ07_08125 [Rugosimonospora sp.]
MTRTRRSSGCSGPSVAASSSLAATVPASVAIAPGCAERPSISAMQATSQQIVYARRSPGGGPSGTSATT